MPTITGAPKGVTVVGSTTVDEPVRLSVEVVGDERAQRRVQTLATASTFVFDSDTYDAAEITAQAGTLTVAPPVGTPSGMQTFLLRIGDDGTTRTIVWDSIFHAISVDLPTFTVPGQVVYVGSMWNDSTSHWDVLAVGRGA